MIVRHIKFQNTLQFDPFIVREIERLTDTKLLVESDSIRIVGEPRNSRHARLLIQHSILLTYLNTDLGPSLHEQENVPNTSMLTWQQLAIEAIKRALCAFNTTTSWIYK
jgi:hypothetical protein